MSAAEEPEAHEPPGLGPGGPPFLQVAPGRLVATVALAVFVAEVGLMGLLAVLPPTSTFTTALIDATLLIALAAPSLYFLVFRPLVRLAEERERAARRLALMGQVVEQVPDSIMITDVAGTIVYVNPAFEDVTGYSAGEVVGGRPAALRSGFHGAGFYEKLWATIGAGERWESRFVNRRKDGTHYEAEGTISPIRDQAGAVTHFVAVQRDSTAARQARRLDALSDVVGGLAHEIANPTHAIALNAQLLQEAWADVAALLEERLEPGTIPAVAGLPWSELRGEVPALLAGTADAAARVSGVLGELKSFAVTPGGALEPIQRYSVASVAAGAVALAEHASRIETQLDLAPDVPTAVGLPGQLEQVLLALLLNAHAFAPAEGGAIRVSARPREGGATVELSVEDNGPGVPPALRARIFEPFFSSRGGRHPGLGLASALRIVRAWGGDLWAEESPDLGGARFVLRFPAAQSAADERDLAVPGGGAPGGALAPQPT